MAFVSLSLALVAVGSPRVGSEHVKAQDVCLRQPVERGSRGGGDYSNHMIEPLTNTSQMAELCRASCCADPRCFFWGLDLALPSPSRLNCTVGRPCCWKKTAQVGSISPHCSWGCFTGGTGRAKPPAPPRQPPAVSDTLDCNLRHLVWAYARAVQPWRNVAGPRGGTWLADLHEGLRLGHSPDGYPSCNRSFTADSTASNPVVARLPPNLEPMRAPALDAATRVYVDAAGSDSNTGLEDTAPLRSLHAAQATIRRLRREAHVTDPALMPAVVSIASGEYFLGQEGTLELGPLDGHTSWIGTAATDISPGTVISGGYQLDSVDSELSWQSLHHNDATIYSVVLPPDKPAFSSLYDRSGARRMVRARMPNGNIERTMRPAGGRGWPVDRTAGYFDASDVSWTNPGAPSQPQQWIVSTPCRSYGTIGANGTTVGPGMDVGACNSRMINGHAARFSPPVFEGPQRALCGILPHCSSCTDEGPCTPTVPNSLTAPPSLEFGRQNWSTTPLNQIEVHAFDHNGFTTLHWKLANATVDSSNNVTLLFGRGGFQCSQASHGGDVFFLDNAFEMLDDKGEWYLDRQARRLYVYPNATDFDDNITRPPARGSLVAAVLERLISIRGESAGRPVNSITLQNITFLHSAATYLSPSGFSTLLGGGDYAMSKNAVIIAESVAGLVVHGCTFSRLGGNAVLLYGSVRDAWITRNLFFSLGANAIVSWGVADFVDGTGDEHPDGVRVTLNVASEVGLIEKQACFYFQALTSRAVVVGNVAWNGPRAAVNLNDGFGGGTNVSHNVFANWVRETGDHGTLNSYNRNAYMTTVRDGTPNFTPGDTYIFSNVWLCSYFSGWSLDHDDASSYYTDIHNVLIFGGVKTNMLGAHNKTFAVNFIFRPDWQSKLDGIWPSNPDSPSGGRQPFCAQGGNGRPCNETYQNNTCIIGTGRPFSAPCGTLSGTKDNRYFTVAASFSQKCGSGSDLKNAQMHGYEINSTVEPMPTDDLIVDMAAAFINDLPATVSPCCSGCLDCF